MKKANSKSLKRGAGDHLAVGRNALYVNTAGTNNNAQALPEEISWSEFEKRIENALDGNPWKDIDHHYILEHMNEVQSVKIRSSKIQSGEIKSKSIETTSDNSYETHFYRS